MQIPVEMWDDERPIKEITLAGDGGNWWSVGRAGVTRIVAYQENGQGASVPWLAVYEGDWLVRRVNAAHVADVWYGEAPSGKKEKPDIPILLAEVKRLRCELHDAQVRRDEWEGMYNRAIAGTEIERLRASLEAILDEATSDLNRDIIITECQSALAMRMEA